MKIYGCGGLGLNLASRLESLADSNKGILLDSFDMSYLDTSDSNIGHNKINKDKLYLIENANGSGKNRAENYGPIKEQIKRIVLEHKPQEFNVVIHSLSGGSGSVIAPILVGELMDQDKDVVVVAVGSADSTIEISNAIKTIKSYAGISNLKKKPIAMIYYENGTMGTRSEIDSRIESSVVLLSAFLTNSNHELDFTDIHNFLNYQKVTEHESGLVSAQFFRSKIEPDHNCTPISCVTLAKSGDDTSTGTMVDYQAVGFINEENSATAIMETLPNHFTLVTGCIPKILSNLEKKLKDISDIRAASLVKKVVSTDGDSDGMVI